MQTDLTSAFAVHRRCEAAPGNFLPTISPGRGHTNRGSTAGPDRAVHATDTGHRRSHAHDHHRHRNHRDQGITGGSGAETIRSSQNATIATVAVDATPEPHAASPAGTPRTAPRRPVHERRTPSPQPLAPRPPGDGRDAPDPFLLEDGDRWVLYSTQVGLANIPVATTPDLATWSTPTDALPQLPTWAGWGHTWAPGVLQRPSRFVLYFAARSRTTGRQCIGAATATSATGPFTSTSPEPLLCQPELGGSIDPHPFVDADGTTYLLWKADTNAIGRASTLFSQRLRPDGLALEGRATPLLRNDAAWEAPLIENLALVRMDGRHVLLYSGGWWESDGYATGYATCDSPLGPCVKATTKRPRTPAIARSPAPAAHA